jgi:hypothetical protein
VPYLPKICSRQIHRVETLPPQVCYTPPPHPPAPSLKPREQSLAPAVRLRTLGGLMRLPLLILALLTLSACSKPAAKSTTNAWGDNLSSEPAALAPRFVFLAHPSHAAGALYRCNTYTGKVDLIIFSPEKKEWIVRTVAAGDAREEVSLMPALSAPK